MKTWFIFGQIFRLILLAFLYYLCLTGTAFFYPVFKIQRQVIPYPLHADLVAVPDQAKDRQRHFFHDRQVLCTCFCHARVFIISKGEVNLPVQAVFHSPMAACCTFKFLRISTYAADIIPVFFCLFPVRFFQDLMHHPNAFQLFPFLYFTKRALFYFLKSCKVVVYETSW